MTGVFCFLKEWKMLSWGEHTAVVHSPESVLCSP